MSPQRLLIPIEFPDPEPLPSTFISGFSTCEVTLFGIYDLPDDVDDDERHRKEIEAYNTLYSLANEFVKTGETAEVELAIGTDIPDNPTELARERDFDAVLVPNPITTLGRVIVPIRDEEFAEPIANFVGTLNPEEIIHTKLLHVAENEDDVEAGEQLLARAREHLVDEDYPEVRTETEVVVDDDPALAISNAARDYDLIIMGETEDPGQDRVFGKTYEIIADKTDHPVVVVLK
ncbi:universal stress protein [Halosimplex sp. J119]